jgi:hypothetical protein
MSSKKFAFMHLLTQLFILGGQVTISCQKVIYVIEGVDGQLVSLIGSLGFLVGTVMLFYILDPALRAKTRELAEREEARPKALRRSVIRSRSLRKGK